MKKMLVLSFLSIILVAFVVGGGNKSSTSISYLSVEKISDTTSNVYRVIDEDYGIVLYIVDTYSTGSAPSISGVRIGKAKVAIAAGITQIINDRRLPKIYRLVDSQMNTVSYIVDTWGLATSPSIVSFLFE